MTDRNPGSIEAEAGTLREAVGNSGVTKWRQLTRLLTDWHFASRVLRKRLGLPVSLETEDRRVLEKVIFPVLSGRSGDSLCLVRGLRLVHSPLSAVFLSLRSITGRLNCHPRDANSGHDNT